MKRGSLEKMRLDRRLAGRHGWISKKDLAGETETFPDASDKIAANEAEAEADAAPAGAGLEIPTGLDSA
jgi:hypothetical protein